MRPNKKVDKVWSPIVLSKELLVVSDSFGAAARNHGSLRLVIRARSKV